MITISLPWIRGPRETKEREGRGGGTSGRTRQTSVRLHQSNDKSPESGLSCDWLIEVKTVKRCEDSTQTSLNNSQRNIAKMAECFGCCETF